LRWHVSLGSNIFRLAHFQLKARWVAKVRLNFRRDERHNIVDSADKMPLKGQNGKYRVHRFLAMKKTCRAAISSMMYSSHLMGRRAIVATPVPLTSCLSIFLIRSLTDLLFVGFPSFRISSHTWRHRGMKWEIAFLWNFMVVEQHQSGKSSSLGSGVPKALLAKYR
jgi:hypothetical protein